MTFPKYRHWLLVSAAALVLPAAAVTWWMLTPDAPRDASSDRKQTLSAAKTDPSDDLTQAASPHTSSVIDRADGTAQRNADADHFAQYAQTLRTEGQPEQTVRELVSSRITADFQSRRAALRQQARHAGATAAEIEAKLNELNREQDALVAQYAVPEGKASVPSLIEKPTIAASTPAGAEKPILAPAVLAEALPATVKTEEQAAAWEKLRDHFVKAVGSENQDPTDPHYRKRWAQAQSEADQRFRFQFGDSAFVQHQLQAQREAILRQQSAAK